jgi:SAM-dependent methyltransferase
VRRDPEKKEAGLIQWCLTPASDHALEIGCGNGRLTAELAKIVPNLVAVEPFWKELSDARRHVGIPVFFAAASGESLPFAKNSFDTIVFTLSLHHQQPQKAISEAGRVLKEDGRILILEPVADSMVSKLFAVLDDESERYGLVEKAINRSGLEVIRSGTIKIAWVFDDFSEMVFHIFDYFGLKPSREKTDIMAQLLGERRVLYPLSIEDRTRFWLLSARQHIRKQ